jgi:hypothetical protein
MGRKPITWTPVHSDYERVQTLFAHLCFRAKSGAAGSASWPVRSKTSASTGSVAPCRASMLISRATSRNAPSGRANGSHAPRSTRTLDAPAQAASTSTDLPAPAPPHTAIPAPLPAVASAMQRLSSAAQTPAPGGAPAENTRGPKHPAKRILSGAMDGALPAAFVDLRRPTSQCLSVGHCWLPLDADARGRFDRSPGRADATVWRGRVGDA